MRLYAFLRLGNQSYKHLPHCHLQIRTYLSMLQQFSMVALQSQRRSFRTLEENFVPELASLFVSRLAFRRHIETSCEVVDALHIGGPIYN